MLIFILHIYTVHGRGIVSTSNTFLPPRQGLWSVHFWGGCSQPVCIAPFPWPFVLVSFLFLEAAGVLAT